MIFAGLDIETTGTDWDKNHRLIQIGIAFKGNQGKCVNDVQPIGDMLIDAEALAINHFTLARIGAAPLQTDIDDSVAGWLSALGCKHREITPVGWNVGGFDMVFIKKELPKTAAFFNYRVLDLTGLAILQELRAHISCKDTKAKFAAIAAEQLGRDDCHDALYDAEAALIAMQLFYEMDME